MCDLDAGPLERRARPSFLPLLALSLLVACGRAPDPEQGRAEALSLDSLARPAGGPRSASTAAPEVPADAPLVVFLGDSLSAGLHLAPSEAFPAVVQRELAADGHPFRLVNAGVSGDTSAGGLRRLDWVLRQEPDVLVVELGGNDGLRGQKVAEVETRLREIVRRAAGARARVLLLGLRLPPSLGAEYTRDFEALYARIAEQEGCALVPFFMEGAGGVPGMMLDDGIHPSRAGHERIARNVAPVLEELLEEIAEDGH